MVSKSVYKELRDGIITPPTAQLNVNARFIHDVLEWKEIYALAFRIALCLAITKNFWAEVIKWLENLDIKIKQLSDKDIMFGILKCEDELFVNHILLVAKQYLYSCRQSKSLPSMRVLNSKITLIYQIEAMISKSNKKLSAHNKKWSKYKNK